MSRLPSIRCIILLVQRDVMIARNHDFEFCVRVRESGEDALVFGEAAAHGDVAGVEEDVAAGQGEAVGVRG